MALISLSRHPSPLIYSVNILSRISLFLPRRDYRKWNSLLRHSIASSPWAHSHTVLILINSPRSTYQLLPSSSTSLDKLHHYTVSWSKSIEKGEESKSCGLSRQNPASLGRRSDACVHVCIGVRVTARTANRTVGGRWPNRAAARLPFVFRIVESHESHVCVVDLQLHTILSLGMFFQCS